MGGEVIYRFFYEDIMLASYFPKKNRSVLIPSSIHHEDEVDLTTGKPEIISNYNHTKGGVDQIYR